MRTILGIALLLGSTLTLAQFAGDPGAAPAPRADFSALDRNRDGSISKIEANADPEVKKRFAEFDANRDEVLSEGEHRLAREDVHRQALRDAVITAKVKAALLADRGIPSFGIAVRTHEGIVRLSGFVAPPEMVSRAGRVTAGVHGVRTVDNDLAVKQ